MAHAADTCAEEEEDAEETVASIHIPSPEDCVCESTFEDCKSVLNEEE